MSNSVQRKVSKILILAIVLSAITPFATAASENPEASITITPPSNRSELTFIEGIPGVDTHLVYTYFENGQKYMVIDDADNNYQNVKSTFYTLDTTGSYTEIKSQALTLESSGAFASETTDPLGNVTRERIITTEKLERSTPFGDEILQQSNDARYTDPGTGEWTTYYYSGSTYIGNLSVNGIVAAIAAAVGGVVAPTLAAIALAYFNAKTTYAYYYKITNEMMSALNALVVLRETVHTTYYHDRAHTKYIDYTYTEYDGRW